jgi:chloramphenicol-sensitive protein RarD
MNKGYPIILCGYIGWGLFPLYWALLTHVPALEVLLHRMIWAIPFLLVLVLISSRRKQQVLAACASFKTMRGLMVSSLFICFNWGVYIWAVNNHQVIEASMGYFLTPLMNVIAGYFIFKERLDRLKIVAIIFAAAGVFYYIIGTGSIPWIGLALGASFSAYGIARKKMETNAIPGLLIETLLLLPFTLIALAWLHQTGSAVFLNLNAQTNWLLIIGGPITIIPLAFFTAGTRMIPMTSVGILFYVTPTLQFLSGVIILQEAFNTDKLLGFVGIWIGLVLFSFGLIRDSRTRRD